MAEALEARAILEVVKRDEVIERFKKECDDLVTEKKRIEKEVEGHQEAHKGLGDLRARVSSLEKELTGSKTAEELALARAQKSGEIAEGFRKDVDAERVSGATLFKEVKMLKKQL